MMFMNVFVPSLPSLSLLLVLLLLPAVQLRSLLHVLLRLLRVLLTCPFVIVKMVVVVSSLPLNVIVWIVFVVRYLKVSVLSLLIRRRHRVFCLLPVLFVVQLLPSPVLLVPLLLRLFLLLCLRLCPVSPLLYCLVEFFGLTCSCLWLYLGLSFLLCL